MTVPTLDLESFSIKSWDDLLAEGAVVQRRVTSGEVAMALANAGAAGARLDWPLGTGDDLYIEFMTALVTPPAIGGNLLGLLKFEDYKRQLPGGAHAIFVASNGPYDFLGTKYFQESEGNRFDRLRVIQDGKTFGFVQNDYSFATPIQGQQVTGLFALPADAGFDPLKPWRLEILINGAGTPPVTVAFGLDYKVPDAYVLQVPAPHVLVPQAAATAAAAAAAAASAAARAASWSWSRCRPSPGWVEAWSDARVRHRDSGRPPVGAHADLHLPGDAGARSRCPPARAHWISAGCSGLARVDRRCAALDRQCHQLCQGAVQARR